jgi:hypothetical protein
MAEGHETSSRPVMVTVYDDSIDRRLGLGPIRRELKYLFIRDKPDKVQERVEKGARAVVEG